MTKTTREIKILKFLKLVMRIKLLRDIEVYLKIFLKTLAIKW